MSLKKSACPVTVTGGAIAAVAAIVAGLVVLECAMYAAWRALLDAGDWFWPVFGAIVSGLCLYTGLTAWISEGITPVEAGAGKKPAAANKRKMVLQVIAAFVCLAILLSLAATLGILLYPLSPWLLAVPVVVLALGLLDFVVATQDGGV